MKSHPIHFALCLAASLFLSAAAGAQEAIKPCVCLPCGGQVECQRGTTGWCECRDGKCHGGCLRNDRDPRRLAASVLTVIVGAGAEIRPEGLMENRGKYAEILGGLLAQREDEQTFRIEYGRRKIGFVFTTEAATQLGSVLYELQGTSTISAPSPSPAPSPLPTNSYEGKSLVGEMIRSNGRLGLLVYGLLLVMGFYSLVVATERHLSYSAARRESLTFAPLVAQALKEDRIGQALDLSQQFRRSHKARVVRSGLLELRMVSYNPRGALEASVSAMYRAVNTQTAELQRRLPGLAAVSRAAPLVGLLGLVIGLFYALQGAASGGAYDGATGSSHALGGLLALAFGILVGGSAWLAHSRLRKSVDRFALEMKYVAKELKEHLQKTRADGRHPSA